MLGLLFIFCAALLLSAAFALSSTSHRCRCRPNQAYWLSVKEWDAFNASASGRLDAVSSLVGSPCHDPNFNSSICKKVKASMMNSTWRASQPGAVQWHNWESKPKANESCEIRENQEIPCHQGRVSLYSLIADSEDQIQQAVRFAQERNIHLRCVENFVPHGSPKDQDGQGPTVTIEAGLQLAELYKGLGAKGHMVVGGYSHGVGAAGGYVQGGGHSILGPWKRMASDNALQFRVITTCGGVVIANEYKNQDLFWALRGVGGLKAWQDDMTYRQEPILKFLEPGRMGAYLNKTNLQEPNSRERITPVCSENWDEQKIVQGFKKVCPYISLQLIHEEDYTPQTLYAARTGNIA
ncbi:hypothetical protein RJZ57_004083 [Blastomyces gilchristii]